MVQQVVDGGHENRAENECDKWGNERIRNGYIRRSVGVASIMDKTKRNRLGWSCYEERRFGNSKNSFS